MDSIGRKIVMNTEKRLYQWDTGQKLVGCTGLYVDFPIGTEVYRVETTDGMCIIPDELLQTSGSHKVYECMTNNTIRSFAFSVTSRPKPPDYVYTPTERLTFEGLVQKVDDAVADMIRRAESGEFDGHTPVKGTDYFTTEEIQQIQNEVSSGAIGEFKSVVDTETETFNNNAETKLTAYNQNDSQKTTAYNTNAETKRNAYNANADNRVAEFDAHTEQIQTNINKLKSDISANKSELDRTNSYLDALFKLNKGQTYDVLEQESEAYSVDVPSGSHYVGVDMVGGKSVAWNQLINYSDFPPTNPTGYNGVTWITDKNNGTITFSGTATDIVTVTAGALNAQQGHKYLLVGCPSGGNYGKYQAYGNPSFGGMADRGKGLIFTATESKAHTIAFTVYAGYGDGIVWKPKLFDLTQMFGSTIADYIYSLEQSQAGAGVAWFKKLFPKDYYPYSEPTIISSQTDRIDMASVDSAVTQQITTGFPVLNSAGSVYDYIDIANGKLHRRVGVVDLGTLDWTDNGGNFRTTSLNNIAKLPTSNNIAINALCDRFVPKPWADRTIDKAIYGYYASIEIKDSTYTNATTFKSAMSGVMAVYELAEEVITDIEIPTELTDWLTVEAGGSITFHNADEGKRLLIPNKETFIRKLDEVTV